MPNRLSSLLLVFAIGNAFVSVAVASDVCSARSGDRLVPLIELYTSEGCSSCPPADRWLSREIATDTKANWLAFHVDYWDDLGWRDRFASPAFSDRQRSRVGASGGSTVYTPQVMIGENVTASWRSGGEAATTGRQAAEAGLALQLSRDGGALQLSLGAVRVGAGRDSAEVWLAQSVDGQQTSVRAGENNGVVLRHDRVVRKLWGPWRLSDTPVSQRVSLPADAVGSDFTAFVQDAKGRTLQSLRLSASQCR